MHLKLCILALALLMSGSLADKCYECVEIVRPEADKVVPNSCAGGKLDKNALPVSVRIKDCPSVGCHSSVVEVTTLGYTSYSRGCATPDINDNKCKDKKSCVCHGDFCNGAGNVNARQAIMGIVAGVMTIVLMQH